MYDKVVVIGSLNYDVCLKLERLPEEGETNFADSVEYCSGGKGANQAVQAAKLGVPVYMAGCIGEDSSGDFLKKTVEGYGVRTDYLKRVPGNSGMSVAQSLYDGGIRASVVRGANDRVTRQDIDELSVDDVNLRSHINKVMTNYNVLGIPTCFLIYATEKDFVSFWNRL